MHPKISRFLFPVALVVLVGFAPSGLAQKKPVAPEEYGKFETIRSGKLSPNGEWLAWQVVRTDNQDDLRIRRASGEGEEIKAPYGEEPSFSDDSKWLVHRIGKSRKERDKLTEAKKPVHFGAAVIRLDSGKVEEFSEVQTYSFSGSGRWLALHKYAPEKPKGDSKGSGDEESTPKGSDLLVRDLDSGSTLTLGNTSEFAWQDEGQLLALLIQTDDNSGNAIMLLDPTTGSLRVLDSSEATYRRLAWRKKSADLATLRCSKRKGFEGEGCALLAWKGLTGSGGERIELDPSKGALPDSQRVAHYQAPSWTEDGVAVWVGVKDWKEDPSSQNEASKESAKDKEEGERDKPAAVEVWHALDVRSIPEQKHRASQDRERTLLAAWIPSEQKLTVLGKHEREEVIGHSKMAVAVSLDWSPYPEGRMFGRPFADLYAIDVRSGQRRLLVKQVRFDRGLSPDGRFFAYFQEGNYWSVDIRSGERRNLTGNLEANFTDADNDHPTDRPTPYFFSLWADNGSILVHDEFDVWALQADGGEARKLTAGAGDEVVHRILRVDDERREIDSKRSLLVSLYGKWTKREGIARLRWDAPSAAVERLVWADKGIGQVTRAKDVDVLAYIQSAFDDSPDYFVGSGNLADSHQVSRSNPFLDEYAWGKSRLIEYRDSRGNRLQGALFTPAEYQQGQKGPMIVNIYEKRSDELHRFWPPSRENYYNPAAWSAEGYFVLLPDITFKPRDPGISALDCVEAAIDAAVATGLVDPQRVGLVGHSWGGYETAYIATRTKKLAAAVAGAALTDLVSMYGSVFWAVGVPETGHFEVGQERMQVPLWEDYDAYVRNSPVHWVDGMTTPLLMEFGDSDRNVNWSQGWELYNFARRLGKQLVMLVYNGEDHGLRKPENRMDYHDRILQWFGHYLKGEAAADWITRGQTYLDRQEEVKRLKGDDKGPAAR